MVRLRITVHGIVQGVGFRPFVYRLACRCHLGGWVLNNGDSVCIEVEGEEPEAYEFVNALHQEKPPLAQLTGVSVDVCQVKGEAGFVIKDSLPSQGQVPMVSPDIATCPDCRRETLNSKDRRFQYPFTNCTNCGPRYTIIKNMPYDRIATTMTEFPMCPVCQKEYDDPADRRFHAQPNACPVCGPNYRLINRNSTEVSEVSIPDGKNVFIETKRLIAQGKIVAVKGLGGYHLACDATNPVAVDSLRRRKIREDKPFAVMCGSLEAVKQQCLVSQVEAELLTGAVRPIVLLDKSPAYNLAQQVAPGNPRIGVMLPYTPAHELLLGPDDVWVMTSGNTSDEPIAYEDGDALERLNPIADYFLVHNRDIYRRADDSVVRIFSGKPYILRRSRGYTPSPIHLAQKTVPTLACGGELKNSFCLTYGNKAYLSAHIGDLENLATYNYYLESIDHYRRLFNIKPQIAAYDLHPEYLSTKYALSLALPKVAVQHHHAHIAAVMAEHGLYEPVIGVAFDGTGYGTDGTLWGGEFLVADYYNFTRAGHCKYLTLPGGTKAVKEPWRLAAWLLYELFGTNLTGLRIPFIRDLPNEWPLIMEAAKKGINSPLTSSAGRLFDAAASIIGLRNSINYEGQAAVELEMIAGKTTGNPLPYSIIPGTVKQLDFSSSFCALVELAQREHSKDYLAASFHTTIANAIVEMVQLINSETGIGKVVLSGGVFQNIRLLTEVANLLQEKCLRVYLPWQTPPNDGGLALGQAIIAAEKYKRS
ncbi:MAG TPA: carbamoyltransferase HypF [Methylomusa anaerophila]|uniref:Carbamoyltransferase n=1 Tax=Methylomusa anaerophila TaxID=1930071 RepID=A0A348ALE6_9FIRM|nr:carbamoyltransferase HypF [Methylomusa anaerophila]BBB91894.1 carbamoyltransferase HypF [Methylomusa anaerophila]HML88375.1 carbamoyltransferase HypF [Methylomusa anaerophila]